MNGQAVLVFCHFRVQLDHIAAAPLAMKKRRKKRRRKREEVV